MHKTSMCKSFFHHLNISLIFIHKSAFERRVHFHVKFSLTNQVNLSKYSRMCSHRTLSYLLLWFVSPSRMHKGAELTSLKAHRLHPGWQANCASRSVCRLINNTHFYRCRMHQREGREGWINLIYVQVPKLSITSDCAGVLLKTGWNEAVLLFNKDAANNSPFCMLSFTRLYWDSGPWIRSYSTPAHNAPRQHMSQSLCLTQI